MKRVLPVRPERAATTWLLGLALSLSPAGPSLAQDRSTLSAALQQDSEALGRAGQLQAWLQEPVPLAQAVCIQHRLAARWPADPDGTMSERDRDRLRLAREFCSAALTADDTGDLRLIPSARAAMQQQVSRLVGLQSHIRACRDRVQPALAKTQAAPTPALSECVAQVLGRPVAAAELRSLLAALD